jgi:hypothetical protein
MRMWSNQMRALLAKDLRLHGRDAALAAGGAFLLIEIANRLIDHGPGSRGSFVFNTNLLLTLLWSDWLITRERSKRTFAWLRGLPVADRVLVSSKFVVAAGCAIAFWMLSSLLFTRELWQPVGTGIVLLCALLSFGGLSTAATWRFPWKLGHILPLLVILVPLLILMNLAATARSPRSGSSPCGTHPSADPRWRRPCSWCTRRSSRRPCAG